MSRELHALRADLHSHSNVSDGELAPRDLVQRAVVQGVELFSLTDHDEVAGLDEAAAAAREMRLAFVPGVEVSVTWGETTVHIVGLGIDPADAALRAGLEFVRSGRLRRAQAMDEQLAALGIEGALEGALAHAGNVEMISRTHFARYLVDIGVCRDLREVFNRFLSEGKPGFVPHRWGELGAAVNWIRDAGGVAVLAHPGRYKLNALAMHELMREFKAARGVALEVSTSNHSRAQVEAYAQAARDLGFEASAGSDFHAPGESLAELGGAAPLPTDLLPVWHRFV